jgi:hypothetical protein
LRIENLKRQREQTQLEIRRKQKEEQDPKDLTKVYWEIVKKIDELEKLEFKENHDEPET